MHRELVRQHVPAARSLDRIQVADEIRDRNIGRGELLDVSAVTIEPRNWRIVAGLLEQLAPVFRDRCEWIVVHFAAVDDRDRIVEQRGERAKDSALCLTT